MRLAIIGSRTYQNLDAVRQCVWEQERTTVIVSGGAAGVDTVAVEEAKRLNMPYEVHLADWSKGRWAGLHRNTEMLSQVDEVIAFWDGHSKGTKHAIDFAHAQGRPVRIVLDTTAATLFR